MHRRIITAILLNSAALLFAQTRPGAQTLTFRSSIDDSEQPYAIYLPKSFRPDTRYPLLIGLHSELSNHRLHLRQIFGVPTRLGETGRNNILLIPPSADADFIVACPFARGTIGYQGIAEADVYDVLADVQRRFPIDRDRIYLTGVSMGGGGALRFALTRPDIWAAVAVVAGAVPPGLEPLTPNTLNLPIRLFHGEHDPIVPVDSTRAWHRRLLDLRAPVEYVEYPGVRHNAWDYAYNRASLFEWLAGRRRNPYPDWVRFVTRSYRYASAYWVRIDGLTPGDTASIDARRSSPSAITVQTQNLDGFTLTPDRAISSVTIDGAALRVKPAPSLSFEKVGGRWRAGHFQTAGKRLGSEGPISEALSGRQIYVYGTLAAGGPEELAARRRAAETAASWSSSRGPLGLRFPVKADSDVTPADLENSDLILFGARGTNSLIARFAPGFPVELNPGAADYGLLFVAPAGKHYALVSSGLPWWGGDDERSGGDPFAPAPFQVLSTLGDFILFKGGLANVIAEGRFTREWKVPPDASEQMRATGTVTIH